MIRMERPIHKQFRLAQTPVRKCGGDVHDVCWFHDMKQDVFI